MAPRWKLLLAIAPTILVLDQWSKFLAIKHLTPGLALAHTEATGEDNPGLEGIGLPTQIRYFYTSTENPCSRPGSHCPTLRLIDKRWHWSYAENPGAAWSILASAGKNIRVPFFLSVSILAMVLIVWFYRRLAPGQHLLLIALALVLGGAVGNFVDRARLFYVIDFIVWYIGTYRWPTFNVADSAISTGVGLIVLDSILDFWRRKNEAEEPDSQPAA